MMIRHGLDEFHYNLNENKTESIQITKAEQRLNQSCGADNEVLGTKRFISLINGRPMHVASYYRKLAAAYSWQ